MFCLCVLLTRQSFFNCLCTFVYRRLVKSLGQAGEIEPETEGILMEYDVDFSEFSDDVLACLPQVLPWTIPHEEISRRRDLRWRVFSSPPGAMGFIMGLSELICKCVSFKTKQWGNLTSFSLYFTYRNECIFTIDPATARDLDDALSCKQLPDGMQLHYYFKFPVISK